MDGTLYRCGVLLAMLFTQFEPTEGKDSQMKNAKFVLYFITIFLSLYSCSRYSETTDEKIRKSFESYVHEVIENFKKAKNSICEERISINGEKYYREDKIIYDPEVEYDVQKTNSIVHPYVATLTFNSESYYREGKTLQECSDSEWKLDIYHAKCTSPGLTDTPKG